MSTAYRNNPYIAQQKSLAAKAVHEFKGVTATVEALEKCSSATQESFYQAIKDADEAKKETRAAKLEVEMMKRRNGRIVHAAAVLLNAVEEGKPTAAAKKNLQRMNAVAGACVPVNNIEAALRGLIVLSRSSSYQPVTFVEGGYAKTKMVFVGDDQRSANTLATWALRYLTDLPEESEPLPHRNLSAFEQDDDEEYY